MSGPKPRPAGQAPRGLRTRPGTRAVRIAQLFAPIKVKHVDDLTPAELERLELRKDRTTPDA